VNFGDDRHRRGEKGTVNEWRELAECLVELDLAIEDRASWATRPEDVDELKRLEAFRDDVQAALARHHVTTGLRKHVREHAARRRAVCPAAVDPRD
jgi:hypothetical protein